ncbi:L,D-transpeptidase [Streptomyces ferrugineus]|uniref:L,D-transpeptidase n=1 Tax=Streptomyces ferrugineus TaxID=1413221 RepID=A0A7M2SIU4_9ACTN|nr:L,D-transpeptidase [Streptomyces ferrugineus]QOV36204.1 L,D-transpeptidase [Streptomyces ferrugineus]
MAGSSSGFVVGLTTAALATVGFLAFQASASVPADLARQRADRSPEVSTSKAPRDQKDPDALPAGSGTGRRVVYSVDDDRVWLVDEGGKVKRTFRVAPGSVDPLPGAYAVTSRSNAVIGTDGMPVEHVVRFATVDGVTIGFSAPAKGATPNPDPSMRTGGIRESRPDGDAMWDFATIGRSIVVIR